MAIMKQKNVKGYDVQTELAKIDKMLTELSKDKSLPTFGDFFLECLILGNAENVNLKSLYPGTYSKLNAFLKEHQQTVLLVRSKQTTKSR